MLTNDDLKRFHQFAEEKLSEGHADSLEQLVSLFKQTAPAESPQAADLAAIRRGVADADAGRTKPVEKAFDEVRSALLGEQ